MTAAIIVTIILSLLLGLAELFSKFQDEPFLVVRSKTAWAYVLLNVLISLAAFYMIIHSKLLGTAQTMDMMEASFMAGLGSAVLMRSKFLKINVRGKEAAIGPEMIINVFLETLERQIDRERALTRKTLVEQCMKDIDFERSWEYVITTIQGARQTASPEIIRELVDNVEKIRQFPTDPVDKSYALGYLVLDAMGETFLKQLFDRHNRERLAVKSDS